MDRSQPSNSSDQQCKHCGRFFSIRGIDSHQRNCRMQGYDALLVEIDDDADPDFEDSDLIVDDDDADPVDVDLVDEPAETSGPQAPPTPDTPSASSGNDGDPDDEAPRGGCPSCGSEDYFAVDELPDRIIQARPKLRQFDRACADCSITDDGQLAPTMEVYAA